MKKHKPKLIAIVGGSGAGKTWLADQLQNAFGKQAARMSLDDFYRDRSHLPERRRNAINFDHPRSIDWQEVERVLGECEQGKKTLMPKYNFATHARAERRMPVILKPLIIIDGLWLLRRPKLRHLFACSIFVDCPKIICLQRRICRDLAERGRAVADVRKQFLKHVRPMHERFVASQKRWANIVLRDPGRDEIQGLVEQMKQILEQKQP